MELKRVVVTGLGALTPIGNSIPEYWDSLVAGVSGAAPITHFDASKFKTQFACEVKGFDPLTVMDRKEARKVDPIVQYAMDSTDEALTDANLHFDELYRARMGVIWEAGIGDLTMFTLDVFNYEKGV